MTRKTGWRAAQRGEQIIRILFDNPARLCQIELEFSETEKERTQEFLLQWSAEPDGALKDIVRQQWTFSPQSSTRELENYRVNLDGVSVLQLSIKPDLNPLNAYATLTKWRVM